MSGAQSTQRTTDEVRDLTAFQYNTLVVLSDGAKYGLAIKRDLESYYNSEVNHGRLYPNLDTLVEMGLVEKSERDKRTNDYALTDDGYDAVVDKLDWTFSKFVTDDDRGSTVRDLLNGQ